jgi:hypothetical protein
MLDKDGALVAVVFGWLGCLGRGSRTGASTAVVVASTMLTRAVSVTSVSITVFATMKKIRFGIESEPELHGGKCSAEESIAACLARAPRTRGNRLNFSSRPPGPCPEPCEALYVSNVALQSTMIRRCVSFSLLAMGMRCSTTNFALHCGVLLLEEAHSVAGHN